MQQLVRGKVSLYYYREKDNSEHYWAEKAGSLYELKITERLITGADGKSYSHSSREYQGILNFLFNDCPLVKTSAVPYSQSGLVAATDTYNGCFNGEKTSFRSKKSRIPIHPGVRGGVNYFSQESAGYGPGFFAGVFANVPLTGASRTLSVQTELTYQRLGCRDFIYQYKYSFIDIGIFLRATVPRRTVRPYGTFGVVRGGGTLSKTDDLDRRYEDIGLTFVKAAGN
jgi:hypothetical protein